MANKRCSRLIEVNRLFGVAIMLAGPHQLSAITTRAVSAADNAWRLSDRCRRDWYGRVQSPGAGRQMLPWWRHLCVVGTSWDFSASLRNSSVLSLELVEWYVTWVTGQSCSCWPASQKFLLFCI